MILPEVNSRFVSVAVFCGKHLLSNRSNSIDVERHSITESASNWQSQSKAAFCQLVWLLYHSICILFDNTCDCFVGNSYDLTISA